MRYKNYLGEDNDDNKEELNEDKEEENTSLDINEKNLIVSVLNKAATFTPAEEPSGIDAEYQKYISPESVKMGAKISEITDKIVGISVRHSIINDILDKEYHISQYQEEKVIPLLPEYIHELDTKGIITLDHHDYYKEKYQKYLIDADQERFNQLISGTNFDKSYWGEEEKTPVLDTEEIHRKVLSELREEYNALGMELQILFNKKEFLMQNFIFKTVIKPAMEEMGGDVDEEDF